jgi:hypothetical protein
MNHFDETREAYLAEFDRLVADIREDLADPNFCWERWHQGSRSEISPGEFPYAHLNAIATGVRALNILQESTEKAAAAETAPTIGVLSEEANRHYESLYTQRDSEEFRRAYEGVYRRRDAVPAVPPVVGPNESGYPTREAVFTVEPVDANPRRPLSFRTNGQSSPPVMEITNETPVVVMKDDHFTILPPGAEIAPYVGSVGYAIAKGVESLEGLASQEDPPKAAPPSEPLPPLPTSDLS